ncbi:MAG: helix-turn-helix domain-containing protein [Acidimicrobiales bacterium]|nr:helix-turn-helix domain-containing protein [Acidimicrobiales bacterium]
MATTTKTESTQANLLKLVRYAADNADAASSKRDAAIREAHRAGSSLREIAEASGISHMTVKRVVERTTE